MLYLIIRYIKGSNWYAYEKGINKNDENVSVFKYCQSK